MKKSNILYICLTAVFTALVCVVTLFLQIPIPLGYFNISNSIILACCLFLPIQYGIIPGSIGAALADLLSYPVWTIPTLIIKAAMTLLFYTIKKIPMKNQQLLTIIAGIISMLIPFLGYVFAGAIIYGSIYTGFSQIPGLFIEYLANCVIFIFLAYALKKIPAPQNTNN